LTEGFGLADAVTKLSEDIDWKRQRAATTGQKKYDILACCQKIYEEEDEKETPLSRRIGVLDFFESPSPTRVFGLLDIEDDEAGDQPTVEGEVLAL
jgi:hypothetical protein